MGWDDEVEWLDKISRRKEGELYLGIEVRELGLIGLTSMKVESWINRTAVTGTMIGHQEARGKGYGTEAKMLLLGHAFRRLNLRKVYSNVYAPNERSLRCQKRCGYVEEGRFKDDVFLNGQYHDVITLAAWRETFEAAEREWLEKRKNPAVAEQPV
jgi:RimJ/RimL family protein N-acetyltransferase